MKTMIKVIAVLVLVYGAVTSCQEETVGYLLTEDASYRPDSMVIKTVLDADPGEPNPEYEMLLASGVPAGDLIEWGIPPRIHYGVDYYRDKWGQPWVSGPIEGGEGTRQVYVSVKDIQTMTGVASEMWKYLKVYGDGTFEVPLKHTIPVGRYLISLNFTNEGYSKDVNDCFTIIIK